MNIDLKLYNTLSAEEQRTLHCAFIASYDTKMGGFDEPEEWLTFIMRSAGFWVIIVDGEFAGLFAIRSRLSTPDSLQYTIFILKEFRGTGVNITVPRAVAMACLALNIPLVALVHLENITSQKSMTKAFPSILPEMFPSLTPAGVKIHLWFYDLRKLRYSYPVAPGVDIYNAIHHWAASAALNSKGFK